MNGSSEFDAVTAEERTLPVPIWVQCIGFRCLAYRDKHARWHDFHTDEPLETVVGVVRYNLTDLVTT